VCRAYVTAEAAAMAVAAERAAAAAAAVVLQKETPSSRVKCEWCGDIVKTRVDA
jgi:hypothetical protein